MFKVGDFITGMTPAYEEISGIIVEVNEPIISDTKSAWVLLDDGFKVICFFEDMLLDTKKMRDLKFKDILDEN